MFNVAIGADDVNVQRAARNAAFQMLNAVLKHVTQYPLVRHSQLLPTVALFPILKQGRGCCVACDCGRPAPLALLWQNPWPNFLTPS
jgi:hypothetical protein